MAHFDTREFEFSHGRKPRGEGVWAFMPMDHATEDDEFMFSPTMTFSEAKRWAKDQMPNVEDFSVGP